MTQLAMFPMTYLNVTRGYDTGTHVGQKALDLAGKDTGIDNVFAPFDGVVKRIWDNGNSVWLESAAPVRYADGTVDYMTILATHDNNVADLSVGEHVKQGQVFYQEGTAGQATGNHVHLGIGRGKFTGNGWFENSYGYWTINNQRSIHTSLWLAVDTIVIEGGGYAWKRKKEEFVIEEQPPVFNARYYLNSNPDVNADYDLGNAVEHWKRYGMKEGRASAPNFHIKEYRANYPDLQKAYGTDYPKYVTHYYKRGINEGRSGRTIKASSAQAVLDKIKAIIGQ